MLQFSRVLSSAELSVITTTLETLACQPQRASEGWGSFEGQRLETGKCQKLQGSGPVFVWNVFLFAPSLQKRAATYLLRDTLERMFKHQAPKADRADEADDLKMGSLTDTLTEPSCTDVISSWNDKIVLHI